MRPSPGRAQTAPSLALLCPFPPPAGPSLLAAQAAQRWPCSACCHCRRRRDASQGKVGIWGVAVCPSQHVPPSTSRPRQILSSSSPMPGIPAAAEEPRRRGHSRVRAQPAPVHALLHAQGTTSPAPLSIRPRALCGFAHLVIVLVDVLVELVEGHSCPKVPRVVLGRRQEMRDEGGSRAPQGTRQQKGQVLHRKSHEHTRAPGSAA